MREMIFLWEEITGHTSDDNISLLEDSMANIKYSPPSVRARSIISMASISASQKHWVLQITGPRPSPTKLWEPKFISPSAHKWATQAEEMGIPNYTIQPTGQQTKPWSCGYTVLYWAIAIHLSNKKAERVTEMPHPPEGWIELVQEILSRGKTIQAEPHTPLIPTRWDGGIKISHMNPTTPPPFDNNLTEKTIAILNKEDDIGLAIRKSNIADLPPNQNMGLFARKDFPANRSLGSYKGSEIPDRASLEIKYAPNNGNTEYVYLRRDGSYVDASDPENASMARWINHSKSAPNAEIVELKDGTLRVRTIKFIRLGDEILSNYDPNKDRYQGYDPSRIPPMRTSPPKTTDPRAGGYRENSSCPEDTESDTDTDDMHDPDIARLMCWNETGPPPSNQDEPKSMKPWQGNSVPSTLACQTCHNPNIRAKAKCSTCGKNVHGPNEIVRTKSCSTTPNPEEPTQITCETCSYHQVPNLSPMESPESEIEAPISSDTYMSKTISDIRDATLNMWRDSTHHPPEKTQILCGLDTILQRRLMVNSHINTNIMHVGHSTKWWSRHPSDIPFGATTGPLQTYLEKGAHMLNLTTSERTIDVITNFKNAHSEPGRKGRLVIHCHLHDKGIMQSLTEVNTVDHLRGAVMAQLDGTISTRDTNTPWAKGSAHTVEHTCIMIIETSNSPPFSIKAITGDLTTLLQHDKVEVNKGDIPWINGSERNIVNSDHSPPLSQESTLDWQSGDPLSRWPRGGNTSIAPGAAAMGVLPTNLKSILVHAGYNKHNINSDTLGKISMIIYKAGKTAHESHLRTWNRTSDTKQMDIDPSKDIPTPHMQQITEQEEKYSLMMTSHGRRVTHQPDDSHSLFRCLATAITGSPREHLAIRRTCTSHITNNWDTYSAHIPDESLQEYLRRMNPINGSDPDTGDKPEIMAI
jgi:hypothetical protein